MTHTQQKLVPFNQEHFKKHKQKTRSPRDMYRHQMGINSENINSID